jgi:hypothetical protein
MRRATTTAQMLVRTFGVIQLVLGGLFWTGNALDLVPLHMLVGFLLVLGLWTLAALAARAGVGVALVVGLVRGTRAAVAARAGVRPALAALAAVWGLIVPILGLNQDQLLVGSAHWVIEVLHLLVGLGAIGQAEGLAARIRERLPAAA